MARSFFVDEVLARYVAEHSTPPDPVQQDLIAETAAATGDHHRMQIGADQGTFLSILTAALRPRLAVEVGTFTGYSALAVARALPPGGRLICCDVSEEWTAIARRHWERAGVADRIDLRLGPAAETLAALPDDVPIDLAFVDADKTGYLDYYEALVPRLADTGVLLVDNVLWGGRVLPTSDADDPDTSALRAFNDHVAADPR
ncbi:MAG: SAM-dependent methyltransferase, partial [Actinomyces sp.]